MATRRTDLTTRAWKAQRIRVLARDGYRCVYCGSTEDLTADHVIPYVLDPRPRTDDELMTMCRGCNGRKGDRLAVRLDYVAPGWF